MRSLKLKRSLVLVVPVVLAGGLIAGCDGDSTELSETDYRVATGKVCEKYQKVIEADQKKVQTLGSQIQQNPQPFIKVVKQFQDDWGQFVSEIKAVDPPPDAQKQIDKFTAALTESEAELDDLARFPRRPWVVVEYFRPVGGGLAPGEDLAAFSARLLAEIRERVPPSSNRSAREGITGPA